MAPLLPERRNPPRFGGGRSRVEDRRCAEAIFFVLRTGCQWNALSATGRCASSTAHDRFQAWVKDGFFLRLWQAGLARYDALKGIDWGWLSAGRGDVLAQTFQGLPVARPEPSPADPQHLCVDKGDDFPEVRALAASLGLVAHVRSRGEEAQAKDKPPTQKARRWVVERTRSWMNRFRSILVRWAKKAQNYLGLLHFACALFCFRAAGLFG